MFFMVLMFFFQIVQNEKLIILCKKYNLSILIKVKGDNFIPFNYQQTIIIYLGGSMAAHKTEVQLK